MPVLVFVAPVVPNKLEAWYRFTQEIQGHRREEYEGWRRTLDVALQSCWLVQARHRHLMCATVHVASPQQAMHELTTGEAPFTRWLQQQVLDLHGIDLTDTRSADLVYTHTFSYPKSDST